MSLLPSFLSGVITVAIAGVVLWFILSRWLRGRALIIATAAAAISAGVGRYSHSGPADWAAFEALAGIAGAILGGVMISKLWLARAEKNNGLADG